MPGTLNPATVVDVTLRAEAVDVAARVGAVKVMAPGPRYWIHCTDKPCASTPASPELRCPRGLGRRSSRATADNVTVSGSEIVCGPVPVITGASLSGSRLPSPTFSIMTSLLSSQSGCSQPLAVLVLPRILSVHVTFLSTPQSFGTTTLKTNPYRRGQN